MPSDIKHDIMHMSQQQLDELFRRSDAGAIPDGDAAGAAIIAPGTPLEGPLAKFVHWFAWQGKVFDAKDGMLRNKILPVGIHAIIASVRSDKSWFDGKDCIVLDYSKTSLIAEHIHDEIRVVAPNFYLGLVYWDHTRLMHFTLDFAG